MPPLVVETGRGKLGEIIALGDNDVPAFQDFPVGRRADETHWLSEGVERGNARFAAGRDAVPDVARQAEAPKLLFDGLRRSRCIGDEDDRPALASPLQQAIRGAGVEVHAIMDHAPDVTENEPVLMGSASRKLIPVPRR